jgi:hypothetical protein
MTATRRSTTGIALAVVLAGALALSVAATGASVTSSGPDTAEPGDRVTVAFEITNSGDEEGSHFLDLGKPAEWSIESREDDGADWSPAATTWSWDNVEPGGSRNPSVTLAIPENASEGTYEVTGEGGDATGYDGNTTHEITVETTTSTPTPTPTPTATPTPTPTDGGGGSTPTATPTPVSTPTPTADGGDSTQTDGGDSTPTDADAGSSDTPDAAGDGAASDASGGDSTAATADASDDPSPDAPDATPTATPTEDSGNAADGTATDGDDDDSLAGSVPEIAGRTGAFLLLVLVGIAAAAALALAGARVISR